MGISSDFLVDASMQRTHTICVRHEREREREREREIEKFICHITHNITYNKFN